MGNYPTVSAARTLAKRHGAKMVVIWSLYGDRQHIATYGKDREHCKQAGKLGDGIVEAIELGKIHLEIPDA